MNASRFAFHLTLGLLAGCGSRTGLPGGELVSDIPELDAGKPVVDAALDHKIDPPVRDAQTLDILKAPDAARGDCPDPKETRVYLVSSSYELYSFNPPTGEFRQIGQISCPGQGSATPFSMAVDRKGIAQVVYSDGRIFRVSTATGSCIETTFVPGQSGFKTFGLGFASDDSGGGETLYVAGDERNAGATGLARISSKYQLTRIGEFSLPIQRAELTGTGAGQLFAFYSYGGTESFIGQIDKSTARVTDEIRLETVDQGNAWAFAFWGGISIFFTHHPDEVPL